MENRWEKTNNLDNKEENNKQVRTWECEDLILKDAIENTIKEESRKKYNIAIQVNLQGCVAIISRTSRCPSCT